MPRTKSHREPAPRTTDSWLGDEPFWSATGNAHSGDVLQYPHDDNNDFKPDSKTFIGRARGSPVQNLPDLHYYVLAFETEDGNAVLSRKLRYECIREVLSEKFSTYKSRMAFIMEAGKDWDGRKEEQKQGHRILDILILPIKDGEVPVRLHGEKKFMLMGTKKQQPRSEHKDDIRWECLYKKTLKPKATDTSEKYLKCLDTLVRAYATPKPDGKSPAVAKSECFHKLPGYENYGPYFPFEVSSRFRPLLELDKHKQIQRIHWDVDIVPVMPEGHKIVGILEKCFGSSALMNNHRDLPAIKKMLRGIRVVYRAPGKGTTDATKVRSTSIVDTPHNGNSSRKSKAAGSGLTPKSVNKRGKAPIDKAQGSKGVEGKENQSSGEVQGLSAELGKVQIETAPVARSKSFESCFIRDIKAPHELSKTFVPGADGGKPVPVTALLRQCYKENRDLVQLPFANIGRKRDYWVPIETLEVVGDDQILRRCGQLGSLLETLQPQKKEGLLKLCEKGCKEIFDQVANGFKVWNSSSVLSRWDGWLMKGSKISSKKDACSPTKQEALKIRNKLGDVKDKVVIIYISGHGSDRQEFLQTVQNRIEAGPQASRRFVETQIFDFQSLGELIRETGNDASPLMRAALDTQFTVAIGIIDTKGITKIKYKEIQAEIRRTGDRKIGAVTICIPKQSLQSFFNCGFDASFLANNCITRKIDAMQGLSNWRVEADQLQAAIGNKIDPCNSIIIGGHISHPDSVSTERSPSVAAIVASIDDKLALYPGSIRLQADRTDKDTCAISGLEKMLIERFMAWKEKHQNYSGEGPTVFYYRGAYNTRYSRAFSIEKDAIQKAHAVVFGKKDTDCVKLAYIIVSRNLHRHWSHLDREDVPFSFTTRDPEGRNTAKYQYNVMYNSTGRFRYELAQLTSGINQLAPLGPLKTRALPVVYAHKLSNRIFDHFRFASHKDITIMPWMARETVYNEPEDERGDSFKRSQERNLYRNKFREHERGLPWRPSLDRKMFYL